MKLTNKITIPIVTAVCMVNVFVLGFVVGSNYKSDTEKDPSRFLAEAALPSESMVKATCMNSFLSNSNMEPQQPGIKTFITVERVVAKSTSKDSFLCHVLSRNVTHNGKAQSTTETANEVFFSLRSTSSWAQGRISKEEFLKQYNKGKIDDNK